MIELDTFSNVRIYGRCVGILHDLYHLKPLAIGNTGHIPRYNYYLRLYVTLRAQIKDERIIKSLDNLERRIR